MRGGEINLTQELGYIAGLLSGDGYLYHDKKQRHYDIEFYLYSERDVDIQTYLIYLLKKANLKPMVSKDKSSSVIGFVVGRRNFTIFFKN